MSNIENPKLISTDPLMKLVTTKSFNSTRIRSFGNIINYVSETELSFDRCNFGPIDSLVLSQLSYLNYDKIVSGLTEKLSFFPIRDITIAGNENLFHDVRSRKDNQQLLSAFINSSRFKETKLAFYVNQLDKKVEKQFSAITFLLSDGSIYIAYRGTDTTIIGWKEDFNMAFTSPVPSQEEGVVYLNTVANMVPGPIRIGGHSKGGNIAVYSAIRCIPEIQNRIDQIFSHDGPGFRDEVLLSKGYQIVKSRIHKTMPQSSIIGMLLQQQEDYNVVKSNRLLFMQHDPFSWMINGRDFQYLPSITKSANYMNVTIKKWMNFYGDQERELFINTLFQILQLTEANTIYDLTGDWPKRAVAAVNAARGINDATRSFLFKTIRLLFVLAVKNARYLKS